VAKTKFLRLDVAARQLDTAVWMFLSGKDRFSVITLAGAASGILTQLVLNAGKQPFADYGRLVVNEQLGHLPKRKSYIRHVNVLLGVDALKHHAPNDAPTIELDEDGAAEKALIRAIIDYIALRGQSDPFVRFFLNYLWVKLDGPKAMEAWNAMPESIKRLRKTSDENAQ
jgi:hypothetical protein